MLKLNLPLCLILIFSSFISGSIPRMLKFGGIKAFIGRQLLIKAKYNSYVEGYKVINGVKKPISTYIIYFNATPIGYIQYYNVYDFPRDDNATLEGLPKNLAAIDLYIGEADFVGQGLGPLLIDQFLIHYVWKYFSACFVDVNASNTQARRAYEKAGFKLIKAVANGKAIWMLRNKNEKGETCIE